MVRRKKQHVSMRGKVIDMDALRSQNEHVVALGNAGMNARGDILGQGGSVKVRREQVINDYYKGKPVSTQPVSLKSVKPDTFETPAEAMARMTKAAELDTPANVPSRNQRRLVDKED